MFNPQLLAIPAEAGIHVIKRRVDHRLLGGDGFFTGYHLEVGSSQFVSCHKE
jgi:hypothetical protein